jgi:hypothetical protein
MVNVDSAAGDPDVNYNPEFGFALSAHLFAVQR